MSLCNRDYARLVKQWFEAGERICSRCGCEYRPDKLCPDSSYTLLCRDPGPDSPPNQQPGDEGGERQHADDD